MVCYVMYVCMYVCIRMNACLYVCVCKLLDTCSYAMGSFIQISIIAGGHGSIHQSVANEATDDWRGYDPGTLESRTCLDSHSRLYKGCRPCRRPRKDRDFGQSDIVSGLLRSQD